MVLAKVTFEYYGAPTLINTMADIRVADAKTIVITPYDKSTLKAMEKAILASDVGITPNNDGSVIRLSFPQPTEERRRELAKQVQKMGDIKHHPWLADNSCIRNRSATFPYQNNVCKLHNIPDASFLPISDIVS